MDFFVKLSKVKKMALISALIGILALSWYAASWMHKLRLAEQEEIAGALRKIQTENALQSFFAQSLKLKDAIASDNHDNDRITIANPKAFNGDIQKRIAKNEATLTCLGAVRGKDYNLLTKEFIYGVMKECDAAK